MCSLSPFKPEGRGSLENTLFHSHTYAQSWPSLCVRPSRKVDLCQLARVFTVTETNSNTAEGRRGESLHNAASQANTTETQLTSYF